MSRHPTQPRRLADVGVMGLPLVIGMICVIGLIGQLGQLGQLGMAQWLLWPQTTEVSSRADAQANSRPDAGGGSGGGSGGGAGAASRSDMSDPAEAQRALHVLRAWDGRRARAYARGDVRGLRALYGPRSGAGMRDTRLLRSYVRRGSVVRHLTLQLVGVEVLRSSRSLIRVRVRDRVSGGQILDTRGARPLRETGVCVTDLVLRRHGDGWRVHRAVRQPSAQPSTQPSAARTRVPMSLCAKA